MRFILYIVYQDYYNKLLHFGKLTDEVIEVINESKCMFDHYITFSNRNRNI